MALPVTVTGSVIHSGSNKQRNIHAGPFISSGGNVYGVLIDSVTTGQINVIKNTDPDNNNFTEAATLGVTSGAEILAWGAEQDGDNLHIVTIDAASPEDVRYHVFSMSSDSFTTSNEDTTAGASTDDDANVASVAIRSDGDVIALYSGLHETI